MPTLHKTHKAAMVKNTGTVAVNVLSSPEALAAAIQEAIAAFTALESGAVCDDAELAFDRLSLAASLLGSVERREFVEWDVRVMVDRSRVRRNLFGKVIQQ